MFLKIFRAPAYFGHPVTMRSIDRFSLHVLHTGTGSLVDDEGVGQEFMVYSDSGRGDLVSSF